MALVPIGYYNPFQHPVSFCGTRGNMIEVSPNTPVTGRDGLLIANNTALDQQVADGLLKRIYSDHPQFKDFNKKVERRKSAIRHTTVELNELPIGEVNALVPATAGSAKPARIPESTLDSKHGLIEGKGPVPGKQQGDLPAGAELSPNGSVTYQNKTFASAAALKAFLRNSSRQAV